MGTMPGAYPYFSQVNADMIARQQRVYMERLAAERDRLAAEAREPIEGGELKVEEPGELRALPAPEDAGY